MAASAINRDARENPDGRSRRTEANRSIFFLSAALSLRFHHTPRVEHRTNTRWSSEAYRSGIASPTQRDAAFVRGAKDRYHRRDPSTVGKMAG
jgi:hypothetical protein